MNNRDNNSSEYEFLRPLSDRPDLEPDPHFVKNLRSQLTEIVVPKERWLTKFAPFAVGSMAIAMCIALVFLFTHKNPNENELAGEVIANDPDDKTKIPTKEDSSVAKDDIPIADNERFNAILEVKYGTGFGEINKPQTRISGSDLAPSSFFVKDNVFYILDNSGKKVVVTTQDEHLLTIQLDEASWVTDIFVDDEGNIYVLDTSYKRVVLKFNKDGDLLDTYSVDNEKMILTAVSVNPNNEIIVHQSQDKSLNLMTGEILRSKREYEENTFVRVFRKNEEAGEIILIESDEEKEFEVLFEQSYGGINVINLTTNQIIFEKTEVAPNTPVIMAETHVYVIDKNGNTLGAVRPPRERIEHYSDHSIRVDNGKIYFLSAELEAVYVYELTPGKRFEKRLQERIDEYFKQEDEVTNIKKLPAVVDLEFTPVEQIELLEEEIGGSWDFIKSIPFGSIQGKGVTLHVYKETNENNRCGLSYETVSLLEFDGQTFRINECTSTSLVENNAEENGAYYLLQQHFKNDNGEQILHSGIELAANGPGKMEYIIYDVKNKKWFSFGEWGNPILIDLDQSSYMEFVIQFPGLHLSWPDATIYRWNNGKFEGSLGLKNALGVSNHNQNEIMLNEKQALFDVTVLTNHSSQTYQTVKYRYENGKLYKIQQ